MASYYRPKTGKFVSSQKLNFYNFIAELHCQWCLKTVFLKNCASRRATWKRPNVKKKWFLVQGAPPKPSVLAAQKICFYCWRIPPKYSTYYLYKRNAVFDELLVSRTTMKFNDRSLLFVKLVVRQKPGFACNLLLSYSRALSTVSSETGSTYYIYTLTAPYSCGVPNQNLSVNCILWLKSDR